MSSIDIKLPNITATSVSGKVDELQSYVYQMVSQLNWALNTIDTSNETGAEAYERLNANLKDIQTLQNKSEKTPEDNFNEIKALIIKSADIVEAYEQKIASDLSGEYVAQSEFGEYKKETASHLEQTDRSVSAVVESVETITDTTIPALNNKVVQNTADIQANATAITSKVSQETYDIDKATMEGNISTANSNASSALEKANNAVDKTTYNTYVQQTAQAINAKVDETKGGVTNGTSWSLKSDKFTVNSVKNGTETPVLTVDKDGLKVNGGGTFSGDITASIISGSELTSTTQLEYGVATVKIKDGKLTCDAGENSNKMTISNGQIRCANDFTMSIHIST